jgi:very-short-patch-repair endonuclease
MIINKNSKLTKYAKALRKKSTLSEVLLWKRIKNKQIKNYKFRRQVPIDNYIVDFYCHELKLVIEVDGGSHYENEEYDRQREMKLYKLGLNILHIVDRRIKRNIEGVIWEIEDWIGNAKPSPPLSGHPSQKEGNKQVRRTPLPRGGEYKQNEIY